MSNTILHHLRPFAAASLLAAAVLLSACDSTTGPDPELDAVVIEGRATDGAGYGKQAANIEGATVTAASIRANGSLQQHANEATTDADGRFSLEVDPTSEVVLLTASADDYSARALVRVGDSDRILAMPLTVESTAEADVYVDARSSGSSHVTDAAVAAYINTDLAADVEAGNVGTSQLASVVSAAVQAQNGVVLGQSAYGNSEIQAKENLESEAMRVLQSQLNGAANASVEDAALDDFFESMVDAWTEAGVDLSTQAKSRAASAAAITNFASGLSSSIYTELRREALRLSALATSLAVEAHFETEGASQATLSSLADARAQYVADVKAAAGTNAMAEAADVYQSAVLAELRSTADLTSSEISAALESLSTPLVAFYSALDAATSAGAISSAYVAFDTAATTALEAHFEDHASAELAAAVLLLLVM